MPMKTYSSFHKLMQKIASSQMGAWFFSRTQHHFDRLFLKQTDGRTNMTTLLAGLPVVVVTSIGAKSGQQRTHPLLCIRDGQNADRFAVIGSNWGQKQYPAWYYNLKANPIASCSIDGQVGQYAAHEAEGEEYARFWRSAADVYVGFPKYKQRVGERDVPIMVMVPVAGE